MRIRTWRAIETAPQDGISILGWWISGVQSVGSIYDGEWISDDDDSGAKWSMPVFWRPLPPDPPRQLIDAYLARIAVSDGRSE